MQQPMRERRSELFAAKLIDGEPDALEHHMHFFLVCLHPDRQTDGEIAASYFSESLTWDAGPDDYAMSPE